MSKRAQKSAAITRRSFARSAALTAATVAVLPGEAFSQAAAPAPTAPATPPQLSASSQAEIEARFQGVIRQFGDRLSGAQKAEVLRLITLGQKGVEDLRAFPLSISDEPATVLKLRQEERRKRAKRQP